MTATDEVSITVKEDDNKPPKAILGPPIKIYAPNTAVDIDGSNSTDDDSKSIFNQGRGPYLWWLSGPCYFFSSLVPSIIT